MAALLCLAGSARAQSVQFQFQGGKLQITPAQTVMFDAQQKVLAHDYAGALDLYDKAIAMDGGNPEIYIQRSVVKREIHDEAGSRADARMALTLAEAGISRNPRNALLYYQRGRAFRLLKDYAQAKQNIQYAMQLPGGREIWQADLNAIALEEKIDAE